ncbi:MAG: extracellular solute-binding protein [Kineosporiaceae bacterium]
MVSFPVPPNFAEVLAARRRRRRRRRVVAGALGLLLVGVGGLVAASRLNRSSAAQAGSACTGPATPLVVASSVDKAASMTRFAADFSAGGGADAEGRCVMVSIVPKASGASATALATGWKAVDGPPPDVWSPTGSIWLPLLESRLAAAQRSSLIPAPRGVPHIAASPMVVAMPRPMATALGWPDKPIGWSDLLTLAADREGWGAYGHPEWGRFSLGKTNPNFSHAGLEGTVATYYAAVNKVSGLTEADVALPATRRFVAGVEQSVARYGDNTASFQTDWLRADDAGQALSYISALVTEENLVAAYNEGNPTADPTAVGTRPAPKVPLVAVYPKEGTFIADHPYAVLSAPWVTAPKRAAAEAFLAYLLSAAVQTRWQDGHFRNAAGVAGPRTGESLGVLAAEPKKVLEPPSAAVTASILDSWSQLRKTANVINLIDVSGSMANRIPGSQQTKLAAAQQAVTTALDLFTDQDEVGLWSFSGGVRGTIDYRSLVEVGPMAQAVRGVSRRQALATAVKGLSPRGDTGLYNSISAAYGAVLERYREDRINAVVVLTDGRNDAVGGLSLGDLLTRVASFGQGKQVRIITIAYGPDADQETLAKIARVTKGASYKAPSAADIPKVYAAALSNL